MVMSDPAMLPPGFRFHPTDEELILHYLRHRAAAAPLPVSVIADVDIYKFDPWELPAQAAYGDREWYFFTPRDRKYPNGIRPNRAAGSGYWKATGTDKPIRSGAAGESVGVKKALVFYRGRPPKGIKTNWIMHEYRLAAADAHATNPYRPMKFRNASMRLDDWVLCRIYEKASHVSPMAVPPLSDHEQDEPYPYATSRAGMTVPGAVQLPATHRMPRVPSLSDLLNDYSLAQLFDDGGPGDMARPDHRHHAALLGHPVLNQYIANSSGNNMMTHLAQFEPSASTSAAGEGTTGKRKRSEDGGISALTSQQAAEDRKPNGSCFGAAFQVGNALQGSRGLGHQMLLHSNMGMDMN